MLAVQALRQAIGLKSDLLGDLTDMLPGFLTQLAFAAQRFGDRADADTGQSGHVVDGRGLIRRVSHIYGFIFSELKSFF